MKVAECRTCQFVKQAPPNPNMDVRQGVPMECHRYPPSLTTMPTPQGLALVSMYPATQGGHWCGEYRRGSDA